MSTQQERILVVEGDPAVSDLISRQTLKPLGFKVKVLHDAPRAIQEAKSFYPDIMIVNLSLPGLSGKDLLVALSSQGIQIPVIVIASQGMESDVIQAFRLGASDYIAWPIREAEVVSAVERALVQVRINRDREQLSRKVEITNRELKTRVRELTTIMGIGKVVSSVTGRRTLMNKIIEGAVFIAEGDKGWLLLKEGDTKTYNLCAEINLPQSIASRIDQPWDDGISSLVAISGEALSIHGPPLKLLKISRLGRSALIVPIKNKNETVGLIVVVRDAPKPFSPSNKSLLEALAEYATIALANLEIYESVENRASSLIALADAARKSERVKAEVVQKVSEELGLSFEGISQEVATLIEGTENTLTKDQTESIQLITEYINRATIAVEGLDFLQKVHISKNMVTVSLVDLARQAVLRTQEAIDKNLITLEVNLPNEPLFVLADVDQIGQVFDSLLTNAVSVSENGRVALSVLQDQVGNPHVTVKDSGQGISKENLAKIFQPFSTLEPSKLRSLDQIGGKLALGKAIIQAHGGKMWVESREGVGSIFHFTLKSAR